MIPGLDQWVKDLALPQLWLRFSPWWKLPYAMGVAEGPKKKKKKKPMRNFLLKKKKKKKKKNKKKKKKKKPAHFFVQCHSGRNTGLQY